MELLTYIRNSASKRSNSLLSVVHLWLSKTRDVRIVSRNRQLRLSKIRKLLLSVELKELINNYGIVDLRKEQIDLQ